jgi:Matrixin
MLRRGKKLVTAAGIAFCLLGLVATPTPARASDETIGARQGHRMTGRLPGKPAYLWIWYGDGKSIPSEDGPCRGLIPPAYSCSLGSLDDCKREILSYLDRWYADFNLVFTFSRPPSGDYYVIVVTNNGGWTQDGKRCDANPMEGGGPDAGVIESGVAYNSNCNDVPGFAGYAFQCGGSAHDCAVLIAHEHAHMVGLEHTSSPTDIMNPKVQSAANGFDKQDEPIVRDQCYLDTQNSYQLMLSALGPWPGGAKPSPLAAPSDAGAADLGHANTGDALPAGGSIGNTPPAPNGDGSVTVLAGFDALARTPPTLPDASDLPAPKSHGCSLVQHPAGDRLSVAIALAAAAALAARVARLHRAAARARRSPARRA